ncbi:hypothetical protein [Parabacteroides sp. AM08-6]|uniref:hypothetical protein n=1 Tax=Parabacteroides sp. AM08-6 TaxID=2292053 RepID=UPI001F38EF1D|nr:hypothetical protein [Parabacteroides sp. AM08-6]
MGTLGCINDMLQRDKENRELRKIGRERLHDTRKRLLDSEQKSQLPDISLEEFEEIKKKIQEKEEADLNSSIKMTLIFGCSVLIIALLSWFIFSFFN